MGPVIAHPLFSLENILYQAELLDLSWLCYSENQGKLYCFTCLANFCQKEIGSLLKDSTTGRKLVKSLPMTRYVKMKFAFDC